MESTDIAMITSNPALLVGLALVMLVQFGLLAWGLIDWANRPADQVRGNRVLWLLLIVLVNIAGPVLYLTIGRLPKVQDIPLASSDPEHAISAVDALYGTGQDDV